MNKTILVYATRWGATGETAREIAKVMKEKHNIEVDLVNLKDKTNQANRNPDISMYDNVILGVSYAKFNWAKEGMNFLKKNKEKLQTKKLFVFISSARCGGAWKSKNYEKHANLEKKFIDKKVGKVGLQLTSRRGFGGYYINQPPDKAETRDWDMIRAWADEIGQLISSA